MDKLFWIALAGAAGTLSRYGLGSLVQRLAGTQFPLGTFAVNVLGSFAFGVIWGVVEHRLPLAAEVRFILLTGFMGAFTTFSTFMFETSTLLRYGEWGLAALNAGGQMALGLGAVLLGLAMVRLV